MEPGKPEMAVAPGFWQGWGVIGERLRQLALVTMNTCGVKAGEICRSGCTSLLVPLVAKSAGFVCRTDHCGHNHSRCMAAIGSPGFFLPCSYISVHLSSASLVEVKPKQDLSLVPRKTGKTGSLSQFSFPGKRNSL